MNTPCCTVVTNFLHYLSRVRGLPVLILGLLIAAAMPGCGREQSESKPTAETNQSAHIITGTSRPTVVPQPANPDEKHERIVFSSLRPGNWDIYYFPERGAEPVRLTRHPGLDYNAVFSPDGHYIVFTSERRGNPDLYLIDLEQQDIAPRLLIDSPAMEDQAAFSPDGTSIAFVGTHDGNTEIYTIPFLPAVTQSINNAGNLSRHPGGDFRPTYSPDGNHIAYSSDRDTPAYGHPAFGFSRQREGEIYVMDSDGQNQMRLTRSADWDGSPAWSDDGTDIYFYSGRPRDIPGPPTSPIVGQEGGFRIWSMKTDGSNPQPITPEGLEALAPALTADGNIAFQTRQGHTDWKIKSINPRDLAIRMESDATNNYWEPDFHPGGAMVSYGTGPAPSKTQAVESILGDGALLATDFPVTLDIDDHSVLLYPMRHTTGLVPHPFMNKVAVTLENSQGTRMVLADFDGTNEQTLLEVPGIGIVSGTPNRIFSPRWSADGIWLSYTQGVFFGGNRQQADIWLMRHDGSDRANLTETQHMNNGVGSFSPDGKFLVFRSSRNGNFDLYLMGIDSGAVKQLTDDTAKENFPVFSPDGTTIAFTSDVDAAEDRFGFRTVDIYILQLNEDSTPGEVRRITDDPGHDSHPWFSPDGEWIVYSSEQAGITDEEPLVQEILFAPQMYGEVFAIRLSDGLTQRLTHNKWEEGNAFWLRPAE